MKFFTPFKTKVTLVLMVMMTFTMTVFAQSEKMSNSTKLFLISKNSETNVDGQKKAKNSTATTNEEEQNAEQSFVSPINIDGVSMIKTIITLKENNYDELEALGVRIDSKFNRIITAMVPVDKIEEVANIANVKKVKVASILSTNTDKTRKKTKAFDALNLTDAAQANDGTTFGGPLLQAYKGKDVIVGIVDHGIQYNHIMFKDANGNSRIKKAYVYSSSTGKLAESNVSSLTTDYTGGNHGSHTSSIAGGSDYTINETYYDIESNSEVTEDVTYGGMAPESDLVLCGLGSSLTDALIMEGIQKIGAYADQVGKPCVISLSLGGHNGPHDGTGEIQDVCNQLAGEGKIIFFSSGNEGDTKIYFYKENATKTNPANTILDNQYYNYTSGRYTYVNYRIFGYSHTWARTPNVPIGATIYVIDTSSKKIVWSKAVTSDISITRNDRGDYGNNPLSTYFSKYGNETYAGYIHVFFEQNTETGKYNIDVIPYDLQCTSYITSGSTRTGRYRIGVSYYPLGDTPTAIDSWGLNSTSYEGGSYPYTVNNKTTTHSFLDGCNLSTINDLATAESVISVGGYISKITWGPGYYVEAYSQENTVLDFSSFQPEGYGPLQTNFPTITAPGCWLTAAYNRYYSGTKSEPYYITSTTDNNPLAVDLGTSMASPAAAGIVALYLQADPTLTPAKIKKIFKETAIHDEYTDADYSQTVNGITCTSTGKDPRFGNGKIDALAGLKYITTYQLDENQLEITDMLPYDEDTEQGLMSYDHKRYVEYPRSMATGWASICLPFSTTVEELEAYGVENAVEYKGTKQIGDYKFMAKFESTTTLNANTPYLVKLTDAKTKVAFKRGENETWSPGDEGTFLTIAPEADNFIEVRDEVNNAYTMTGTEIYYDGSNNDSPIVKGDYIFSSTTINAVKGGNKLRAFRAYLKATPGIADAAQIAGYTFDGEDLTGVEAVQVDELFGGPAYNLRGQRVTTPQKGIIIQNGKKRVVK